MLCLSGRVEIQVGSTTLSPEDGFLGVILTADSTSTSMGLLDGFLTVEQSGGLPSDPISIPVKSPKRLSSVPFPPGPSIEMPLRHVCGGHSQFCLHKFRDSRSPILILLRKPCSYPYIVAEEQRTITDRDRDRSTNKRAKGRVANSNRFNSSGHWLRLILTTFRTRFFGFSRGIKERGRNQDQKQAGQSK